MTGYDASPAARRPLMTMFWSAQGWREPRVPPAPADLARAVAAGVMFTRSRSDSHDGWVAAARQAAAAVTPAAVGEAFLESLTSRRLDLRSALGSYAIARVLPEHRLVPARGAAYCAVCEQYPHADEDLNVLTFERFKWGGVRRPDLTYVAFDLEQFARAPRTGATAADRRLGWEIIDALRALPADAGMGRAVAALRMVAGNAAERELIAESLAFCGIWRTRMRSDYSREFGADGPAGDVDAALALFLPSLGDPLNRSL